MLEQFIETILPTIISIAELMGIFVVAWSAGYAFLRYLQNNFLHKNFSFKAELANGLATALEFKMAAEILKTVLVREKGELIILGAVVGLRALMSVLIHFELRAEGETAHSER